MEKYKLLKPIGDGAYGTVYKAMNVSTGQFFAIKQMKSRFRSWEDCLSLREIQVLKRLLHPNIVKLIDAYRVNDQLYLVFDFLEKTLYQTIISQTHPFPESQIKGILQQILQGLDYMHRQGYFHRDLKPENLMLSDSLCKIVDFGLAREIYTNVPMSDYVSTRWYRAPEMLLRSTNYSSSVDIFALGCIMAEMYMRKPLAPGSNEKDQLMKLCTVLGTPSGVAWPEGFMMASEIGYRFPQCLPTNFNSLMPAASYDAIQLMLSMLRWDPCKRPTAAECLRHRYFTGIKETAERDAWDDRSGYGRKLDSEKVSGSNRNSRWNQFERAGADGGNQGARRITDDSTQKSVERFASMKPREDLFFPSMFNSEKMVYSIRNGSREQGHYRSDGQRSELKNYEVPSAYNKPNYEMNYSFPNVTKNLQALNSFSSIGNNIIAKQNPLKFPNY